MRKAKSYFNPTRQVFYPEIKTCPACNTKLVRYATLSRKTIITLQGPLYLTHHGYRCPNSECFQTSRVFRSAVADSLALPGFTFGLDIVVWVGHTKLSEHQTLDEAHRLLSQKLAAFELTISRREIMYLFEAYCQLLSTSQTRPGETEPDYLAWLAQVEANGGLIISIDGIQPDKGNETVYLIRDVLTGRVLVAENVKNSDVQSLKALLAPVQKLPVPVLGTICDAQVSEIVALSESWPEIPHQICQFHYLKEASRPIFEQDRAMRAALRKDIQNKLRDSRWRLEQQLHATRTQLSGAGASEVVQEINQLTILDEYAAAIGTALNLEGSAPFDYCGIEGYEALAQIEASLQSLVKKGAIESGSATVTRIVKSG